MRTDTRPPAIVIGLDSLPGIQTARILAGHGVPVIGIAEDLDHAFCRTRVCQQILAGDPATVTYVRKKNIDYASAGIRWSTNLVTWTDAGVTSEVIEDLGDTERVQETIASGGAGGLFVQLNVDP